MKQEIIEGNKMISVFDGMQIGALHGCLSGNVGEKAYRKVDGEITEAYSFENLKYHTSWDWLMPVVERIENSKHPNFGEEIKFFVFEIRQSYCSILGHTGIRQPGLYYQTPYGYEPESKIMAVWEAVIGFITWYNQNPK